MAKSESRFGGFVPTGTYLDMCANLPVCDPEKILCPVMIIRGEHDGIASPEDLISFYEKLPTRDKVLINFSLSFTLSKTSSTISLVAIFGS